MGGTAARNSGGNLKQASSEPQLSVLRFAKVSAVLPILNIDIEN